MVETHPFGNFVPQDTQYLFLGSFTGRIEDTSYDWFYANKRNQFWSIMEEVYGIDLSTKAKKQELFSRLKMAITDIIISCERKFNSNLDMNLIDLVFNTEPILKVIKVNKIKVIYFSSRFAENLYKKHFKNVILKYPKVELITLPSPSPRYAAMTKLDKIKRYKMLLPKLNS